MLLRLVGRYLAPYRAKVALVLVLQLVGSIASLYLPSLNASIIDRGVATADTGYIVRTGAWMLAVSLVQIAATVTAVYLASQSAMSLGRDLRAGVFGRVLDFSAQEVSRFGAPTLISRSTNDVTQVQTVVFMALAVMVSAPLGMVGGIIMASREDVGLSWLVAVAVPVLAIAIGLVVRRMLPQFRVMQTSVDSVNRILREQITGIRVVRAFVREDVEATRFADANQTLTGTTLAVGRLQALMFPIVMIILNASTVGVLWFGAGRVQGGSTEIGQLTAFMAYLVQILMSVMMATFMAMMIPRASVSSERITAVLTTESSVAEPASPVYDVSPGAGSPGQVDVVLEDVDFHYPGAEVPVLQGVSFRAAPGETTAIIGSTGAGKTTLVGLIPRLFDATGGRVVVGGTDVRDLALDALWGLIGLVPQKPYLFTGTVASNLRYGNPDATDEQLWEALRIAQAADFVAEMPLGLDAPIAQGGTTVSGGQRQRLAIARALVAQPKIYLFDDSFSALDLSTDARLRSALRPVTRDATVIVVAQRVSTIVDADRIVVLDDGVVVGQGRHTELLETCETYQEIVSSQAAVEVAA